LPSATSLSVSGPSFLPIGSGPYAPIIGVSYFGPGSLYGFGFGTSAGLVTGPYPDSGAGAGFGGESGVSPAGHPDGPPAAGIEVLLSGNRAPIRGGVSSESVAPRPPKFQDAPRLAPNPLNAPPPLRILKDSLLPPGYGPER
jgi:hypothetical protein